MESQHSVPGPQGHASLPRWRLYLCLALDPFRGQRFCAELVYPQTLRVTISHPTHSVHEWLPMQGYWFNFQYPHFNATGPKKVTLKSHVFFKAVLIRLGALVIFPSATRALSSRCTGTRPSVTTWVFCGGQMGEGLNVFCRCSMTNMIPPTISSKSFTFGSDECFSDVCFQ